MPSFADEISDGRVVIRLDVLLLFIFNFFSVRVSPVRLGLDHAH